MKISDKTFDVLAALNRKVVGILGIALGVLTVVIPLVSEWSAETGIAVGSVVAALGVAKITLNYLVRAAQQVYYAERKARADGGADEQGA